MLVQLIFAFDLRFGSLFDLPVLASDSQFGRVLRDQC